jgi:uncharacterized membrane protein
MALMTQIRTYHWSTRFGNLLLLLSLLGIVGGVVLMMQAFSSIAGVDSDGQGKAAALSEAILLPLICFKVSFFTLIAGLLFSFIPPRFIEEE